MKFITLKTILITLYFSFSGSLLFNPLRACEKAPAHCDSLDITEETIKKATDFMHNAQKSYKNLLTETAIINGQINEKIAQVELAKFRTDNPTFIKAYINTFDRESNQVQRTQGKIEYKKILKENPLIKTTFDKYHAQLVAATDQIKTAQQKQKEILDQSVIIKTPEEAEQKITEMIRAYNQEIIPNLNLFSQKKDLGRLGVFNFPQENNLFLNENFNNVRKNAQDVTNGLIGIATTFGKNRAAGQIAAFGAGSVFAIDAIRSFAQFGATGAINPYCLAFQAIGMFSTLFGKKDDGKAMKALAELFMQGIQHIANILHQHHIETMKQFADVKNILNQNQIITLEKFFELRLDTKNFAQILNELHQLLQIQGETIFNGLDSLHTKLDTHALLISNEFKNIHIAEIDDLIALMAFNKNNSVKEFCRLNNKLFVKATTRAATDALTGGDIDVGSFDALQIALEEYVSNNKSVYTHPAFMNINLLSRYLATTTPGFQHEALVNPLVWAKCTTPFINHMNQRLHSDQNYPSTEKIKNSDIEKLRLLKAEGQKILTFIETIQRNNYLTSLVEKYKTAAQNVCETVVSEREQFEKTETKKLHDQYRAFAKKERAKIKALTNDRCEKCLEGILKTANTVRNIATRPVEIDFRRPMRGGEMIIHTFKGNANTPECQEAKTATQFYNHTLNYFLHVKEWALKNQSQATTRNLAQIALNLSTDQYTQAADYKSWMLYPIKEKKDSLPMLFVPLELLITDPLFTAAGNNLGTIIHKYDIEQGNFYIRSYLVTHYCSEKKKIKLQELYKPYTSSTLYDDYENVLHYWYGGKYPMDPDTYIVDSSFNGNFNGRRYTGYFSPTNPYPATTDTFVSTAIRTPLNVEEIKQELHKEFFAYMSEKRLAFNQTLNTAFTSHSTVSKVIKAAQQFDVYFKLLDSYLTLMYNDLVVPSVLIIMLRRDGPYDATTHQEQGGGITYAIRNSAAIKHYIAWYNTNTQAHAKATYLPNYIDYTARLLEKNINNVLSIVNVKPDLKPISDLMMHLDDVIKRYSQRMILPSLPKALPQQALIIKNTNRQSVLNSQKSQDKTQYIEQLIENNGALSQEVLDLKKQLAALKQNMYNVLTTVAIKIDEKFAQKALQQIEAPETQAIKKLDPHTKIKTVARQEAAECGYHALYNSLHCFDTTLSLDTFLDQTRTHIQQYRAKKPGSPNDLDWLSEDEITYLRKLHKNKNVTMINDITLYKDGACGLERTVLKTLRKAQMALKTKTPYKHAFVLGTMNARTEHRFAHWIAVELNCTNNHDAGYTFEYSIMDSLSSGSTPEQVTILQNILHIKEDRYEMNLLASEKIEEIVGDYVSQLNLSTVFNEGNRCYARHGDCNDVCPQIINKTPHEIVDSVLNTARKLLEETETNPFWSSDGYIDPKKHISTAFVILQSCDNKPLLYKDNADDMHPEIIPLFILTNEQKEQINALETLLN